MRLVYDPTATLEGWWDPTLTLEGWFDDDAAPDLAAPSGITPVNGSNNRGSSTGPSLVLPGSLNADDYVLVVLSLNNSNVITASPSEVTAIDTQNQGSSMTTVLYEGRVGALGLTSADTLSWTLSSSRQWQTNCFVWRGVDPTTAFTDALQVAAVIGSSTTTPAITTSADGHLVEVLVGKSNGTAITAWTPPASWTNRQERDATTTFEPSSVIGDYDGNPEPAGTYGSDTWTPDQTPGATVRYTLSLKPAGSGSVDATFATSVGDAPADGGSSSFTGTATFTTTAGDAPADGGSTPFTGAATFATSAASAPADGGPTSFAGDAAFTTTAADATADGGSTTFTGDGLFTTVVADSTADGGASTFTGGSSGAATFSTVEGAATADGGSTTFTGAATFTTAAADAAGDGGSSPFTGAATFTTLVATAPADGGSTAFAGDATFTTAVALAPADGGTAAFSGTATFATAVAEAAADGGSGAFTGENGGAPESGTSSGGRVLATVAGGARPATTSGATPGTATTTGAPPTAARTTGG